MMSSSSSLSTTTTTTAHLLLPQDENSLTAMLIRSPSSYADLNEIETEAISHLISAVDSLKSIVHKGNGNAVSATASMQVMDHIVTCVKAIKGMFSNRTTSSSSSAATSTTEKLETALTQISRAIYLQPNDYNLYNILASIYLKLNDVKSCLTNLRYVLKLLPNDINSKKRLARVLDVHGLEYLKLNDCEMAISCFSEACKLDYVVPEYYVHKCIALVYHLNYNEALIAIDRGIVLTGSVGNADLFCIRGKIYWALGLVDNGNREFEKAKGVDEMHPEVVSFVNAQILKSGVLYNDAINATQCGDFREAIDFLTMALTMLNDSDVRILMLRSKNYRAIGNYELSLCDIDDVTFTYCKSNLGDDVVPEHVHNKRTWLNTQSLLANYKEPNFLTHERNLTLNLIAVEEMKNGKYFKAIEVLNRVIEDEFHMAGGVDMDKVDAKYFINRGDCYRSTNQISQALSDFHLAHDSDPTNWQTKTRLSMIHYMAGLQLFNEGKYALSEVEFTDAIKFNGKVAQYYGSRGKACFYMLDDEGAYRDFKKALALDPGDLDVRTRMLQFDPNGRVLEAIMREREREKGGSKGTRKEEGDGNIAKGRDRNLGTLTMQNQVRFRRKPMDGDSKKFTLPILTNLTQVAPHMKAAVASIESVKFKRETVDRTFSVSERRSDFPLAKGVLWSIIAPPRVSVWGKRVEGKVGGRKVKAAA